MLVNVWLEIRNNFDWPAATPEEDTELQAKNRETLSRATDMTVVTSLFKTRRQGPRTWAIYSLNYVVDTEQELEQAVERFASENPGMTNVMGAWYGDYGNEFGTTVTFTEVPNPDYNGDTVDPTIPNPDYQPEQYEADGETPRDDYDPRETLRNPAYDGRETLTEIGQSGPPLYPIPGNLLNRMPDVWNGDDPPTYSAATELTDVNLLLGQAPRIFG